MKIDYTGEITDLIPQRWPFVMVDKILDFTETTIKVIFKVKNEDIFCVDGKFIESGIIEHMAQSVALHTGYSFFLKQQDAPTGYIGSIKNLTIENTVSEGDIIETEVEILQEFAGITLVDITTRVNGEALSQGQMKTVIAS